MRRGAQTRISTQFSQLFAPKWIDFCIFCLFHRSQGQCSESGSILPKNWINEGPGPPVCPSSCSELSKPTFDSNGDSSLNMDEINRFYAKQQCLEYLGDHVDNSPEQICKKSTREISNKIRVLRLRHCCERNVYSAIHNEGLIDITNGGGVCVRTLRTIIDSDALAMRITCGLNDILFRYDCRQIYSITHGCNDCKVKPGNVLIGNFCFRDRGLWRVMLIHCNPFSVQEAYRRWVCSTLIPYFAEPSDIRHKRSANEDSGHEFTSTALAIKEIQSSTRIASHSVEDPVVFKILNRWVYFRSFLPEALIQSKINTTFPSTSSCKHNPTHTRAQIKTKIRTS